MLDPFTALGLAGNLIQFIEFSSQVVCKARDLDKSKNGSVLEANDAETIAQALISLNLKIKKAILLPSTRIEKDLQKLCDGCDNVAKQLVEALTKLKVEGTRTKWKSIRQAMKWVLGKERLDEISKRLATFQNQLSLNLLVALSDRLHLGAVASAKNFDALGEATTKSIAMILENRHVFDSKLDKQAIRLGELHAAHHGDRADQQKTLLDAVNKSSNRLANLHHKTLKGQVDAAEAAIDLRRDILNQFEEIKVLIGATLQARGVCEQKKLKENTTRLTAAWLAKQTVYSKLLESLEIPERPRDFETQIHESVPVANSRKPLLHKDAPNSRSHSHFSVKGEDPTKQRRTSTQFDVMMQSLQLLGFTGKLFKLPKSLQFAAANRLSYIQLEKFRSVQETVGGDPRPLFFFGTDLFPASIFQRTTNHGMKSLGLVSKLMTIGTLYGYHRYTVYGKEWPAIAPSRQGNTDKVVGMLVFGLNESQRQNLSRFQDGETAKSAMVEIVLNNNDLIQLEAYIYPWVDSPALLIPPGEQMWSPSKFLGGDYSQWILESTADSEMALEYGDPSNQAILTRHIRDMGFSSSLCKVPPSMLVAILNRFSRFQIESEWINEHSVRPVFFSGSSMFPASIRRRTPGTALASIAKLMTPGTVRGFKRYAVRNLENPALYPTSEEDSVVKGMVVFGLPNQQQAIYHHRGHDFQGGMYKHEQALAEIELSDGSSMRIDCDVFIWNGPKDELVPLDKVGWSPELFIQGGFYKETANTVQEEEARMAFNRVCQNLESLDIAEQ